MSHPSKPRAKPLAELIGGSIDPLVRKRGLARAELISWWPDIVGAAYAGRTAPERIRWTRDGTAATLVVHCDPSLALQFQHEADRVRERLNAYFGYAAVGAVRIVQQRVGPAAKTEPEPRPPAEIPAAMREHLESFDAPLRESLSALARAVLAKS
ncbi:MAG: DUF721 domain-containing protein [Propylenella sp.]